MRDLFLSKSDKLDTLKVILAAVAAVYRMELYVAKCGED
jgi:hypothetical protein